MDLSTFFANTKPNATIKVVNQEIAVNKHLLAFSSKYFEKHFDDRQSAAENIELPPTTTIEDFKRLIATLPPEPRQLDDNCFEAILTLADHFAMDNVLIWCRNFLLIWSYKPKLFKFRMAHKCGWNDMKGIILRSMYLSDHNGKNFLENATEFAKLDDDAKASIAAHHAGLIPLSHILATALTQRRTAAAQLRTTVFTNAKPDTTITVEKEEVAVNKYVLILASDYFDRYFLDDRYPKAENIELPPSTTVEDFKRMIATLPPEQRRLDDDSIEAILILADRFFMDGLIKICRNFILRPCRKPKLFKFRMAHKYGWEEKEDVLRSMQLTDLSGEKFTESAMEFGLLDDDAKAAFSARHAEL